jgi:type I restriction enzyme R subunit
MSRVGQIERATQNRVVTLFQEKLGFSYLGNWEEREFNSNIEEAELRAYLESTERYSAEIIQKAIFALKKEAAINSGDDLYTANKEVYSMLRYGTARKAEAISKPETVHFIDWENPDNNRFAIAEEVTIKGAKERRPDIVIFVNGIAVGVLELKKASVSSSEGIRQNLSNQLHLFNKPFFTTIQLVMAGNDSNGLHYGTTNTPEKYFLTWKEDHDQYQESEHLLDKHLLQFCNKERLLDVIHNFIVFDFGRKKLCRPNQYFGIKEAKQFLARKEGGIIWHTQGSGKSLTMVWLAKWVLENNPAARVLIVTDRTELDEQIEGVFTGVGENIVRTRSGADLINKLNQTTPRLLCSLVHKFGGKDGDENSDFIAELKLSKDFRPQGQFIVFIDECHRTQSGELHDAMKGILPEDTVFIGFTGTPLLKKDKKKSLEVFGRYIHTYKFDEAVKDGVVLDLLYEARDVDQHVWDQKGIDEWFEVVTQGMNAIPKAELKQQWGTVQKVLSTKSRLERIVCDIKKDFLIKPRLRDGRGNAMLVARSIYEACRYYDIFQSLGLKKCGIITSFEPNAGSIKIEETGDGETEKKEQFETYQRMLRDYGFNDAESFEKFAKKKFKEEPANMQLLIVVDKLLTGFDAVHCTYLYIDKQMQDHSLFQAICRTNRLGKEDENDPYYKEFGYIVDYKNLLDTLNRSITDYTSGAFDAFDKEDVNGLLIDRLVKAKSQLEDAFEALHQLCLDVPAPKHQEAFFHYFCGDPSNPEDLKDNEDKRLTLYKLVVSLIRAYNNLAPEMEQAGYTKAESDKIKQQVNYYAELRNSIKHYSSDYIDLKKYEPEMRQMLDMYLTADPSKLLSNLGDATLLQLIVDNGIDHAVSQLPGNIKASKAAMSETIENNMRRTIIQEMPVNPAYYEKMSVLLLELIRLRKEEALSYEALLREYEQLAKEIQPNTKKSYPAAIQTQARQALYDNLDQDESLTIVLDERIRDIKDDNWRGTHIKRKKIEITIRQVLADHGITNESDVVSIYDIVYNQQEY